jgi:hypothetical protein
MAFAGMMQNKKISVAPSAIFMDFPSAEPPPGFLGERLKPQQRRGEVHCPVFLR